MKARTYHIRPCALAVASALTFASNAMAQQTDAAADQPSKGLERIEVTARKSVESLQEVPVAITSLGAAKLEEVGTSVLTEVAQYSPNTTLQTSRGTNSTLTAFIRGVGQQDPLWGYEPGVGIYIDDVYVARPQGAVLDLLDVQRIEVLRGPQGTLYGKNTIGGAVKYVTKPMSGDPSLTLRATVGNYGQKNVKVTGQYPLVEDTLYVGFGYANLNRDGYGDFLQSALDGQDRENYNKDLTAARITLEFTPRDDLFFRLAWDKTDDKSNAKGGYRLLPSLLTDAPVPDSKFDSYTSLPTWNKVELEGISLLASWDVSDNLTLKYIGSSRESYSPTNIDFDNTAIDIFDVPAIYDDENTTHELQANYLGDNFKLVSGLYYYDGESCGQFEAILGFLGRAAFGTPGLTREVSGCNNSESIAAYAQASFDVTDKLSLTLGARYTDEEKQATVYNGLIFDNVYPESGWVPGYTRPDGQLVPQVLGTDTDGDGVLDAPAKKSWSRLTPRIGVEYQVNNDMMLFASYSQGFKSGTFNPRATENEPAVDPEVVDSFEVGLKADWNDSLRTNITLFQLDHKDRQYISVLPGDSATDLNQYLGNVGESNAKGVEAEITWAATDDLTFDIALGFIDGEFEEVIEQTANGPINIADRFSISNTPDYTANIAAKYLVDVSVGEMVLSANYSYRDDYSLFEQDNLLNQDGYGLLNLSAVWYSDDGHWQVGVHAKNLTDEEYLVGGYQFVTPDPTDPTDISKYTPGLGGDNTLIGYYGDPRTFQVTVGYTF
ncbi:TonB-dependent receptor [Aestuariibacter halophilus]|uniref:TonB-dependent receptor n=1 Tax=Fluctibacter halophilus TaxID=226011 RepID=A0ABS8G679_9ALTE|nr:TonB-dependent receptor [Aestuariibacter halophilus]MCC2616055.1 TonB-dependent receptor [Aestuariibacter halophilus]